MDTFSDQLRTATQEKIKLLETIRGQRNYDLPFWDVVVLTALDEDQKGAYEYQLEEKLKAKELPLDVKYHVFSDPVGKKVGNGGSTMVVIDELDKIYGDNLCNLKVLIIHAGGFSQRLPNGSLLGKIFMPLPMGNPIYQMLELKLAMYIEFPSRMKGGIFVCSSDTIEVFQLEGDWTFEEPGFTALGHPSSIEIGTTHGVFVLEKEFMDKLNKDGVERPLPVEKGRCRRFLHKPTKTIMRDSHAVFLKNGQEYIFSDSAFYIDFDHCLVILKWYRSHRPIACELDAYGDFLQSLGPEGTSEYCQNVQNVTEITDSLVTTREEIFKLLHGSQLNVLLMNCSKFYHMGTFPELIEHFCGYGTFRHELGTSKTAMVKGLSDPETLCDSLVLLHSVLEGNVVVEKDSVVEYCVLQDNVHVERGCVLSNVIIPIGLHVPPYSFMHTICIKDEESCGNVTVCFSVKDNLKKCVSKASDVNALTWYGVPLGDGAKRLGITQPIWNSDCGFLNLWHAKLFPLFKSPEDSFRYACWMANMLGSDAEEAGALKNPGNHTDRIFSMAELLKLKDLAAQLEMRENLRKLLVGT